MNGQNDQSLESHDFDDGANDLWALYEKEAQKDDEALIKPLKKDMDAVLVFVCACFFWSAKCLTVDIPLIPGWLVLRCSHGVCRTKDSGFATEPRKSVGLLPRSIRSDP